MWSKKTKGRQRVEMKMISRNEGRHVTFSKRKFGICKKASDLCTLCGVEIGIIFFSPAGNPFSFAHPRIESIARRFQHQKSESNDDINHFIEAYRKTKRNELNQQYNEAVEKLEAEKKRAKALKFLENARQGKCWWEAPIHELSLCELQKLDASMEEFQKCLSHRINEIKNGATAVAVSSP